MTVQQRSQIETQARECYEQSGVPGMSIAVVDGRETVFAAGFGDRQVDPERPATADTLYGIGSSTKPITATAVLSLVDDGAVALDDAVSSYVPYFEDAPGDPITVHELLSHTSGMPADDTATVLILREFGMDPGIPLDGWDSFREYVAESVDRRRLDHPGCLYYNSGYVVLSRLVETVSGLSFPEFVAKRVLDPLGMTDSTFDASVVGDDSRDVMTPYLRQEELRPGTLPDSPLFQGPGGLQASVTDLSRFLAAWTGGDPPIDGALAATMQEPVGVFQRLVDGTEQGYGYGWMTRPFADDVLVGHGGGTAVSAGYLGFLRERGLGVALGCNAQPSTSPEDLAVELLATLTGTDSASVLPERAVEQQVERITGEYESYRGIQTAAVDWTGERLEIEHRNPMDSDTVELFPVSLDPEVCRFRTVDGDGDVLTVEFDVDDDEVAFLIDRVLFERVGDIETGADDDGEN
jgi:CubicO group peptidase (beta-lactamase class C family)